MKTLCRFTCVLVFVAPMLVVVSRAVSADSNIHLLTATLDNCGCDLLTTPPPENHFEWYCAASFTIAAPPPHYTEESPVHVSAQIDGEAIGQCGALVEANRLPLKVNALFYLKNGGPDFKFRFVRSSILVYHLSAVAGH